MSLYRALWPFLSAIEPEAAHRFTVRALQAGAGALFAPGADPPSLGATLAGMRLRNPVGLAAGFDKDGEAVGPLLRLGFGHVEIGTVTPLPQPGNARPRLFRLVEDRAIINCMGFNNRGAAALASRLAHRRPAGIIGISIGANRTSSDMAGDYVTAFNYVAPYADYIALNVSSPNTRGLRRLQERTLLQDLLGRLSEARAKSARSLPVFLKVSPDLDALDLEAVVETAVEARLAGLIVSNTTIGERAGLKSQHAAQVGGLSGVPLFRRSTACLAEARRLAGPRLAFIGVGGIACARDAYEKILSGASLVQLYTALIYQGPSLVAELKRGLVRLLKSDGFSNIAQAVGAYFEAAAMPAPEEPAGRTTIAQPGS